MVNWKSKKLGDFLVLANTVMVVILINILGSLKFFRLDLTEEKRYSIKTPTKELLQNLDEEVYIEVFLEGELNAAFKRFRKSIEETLEEFRIFSKNKVRYTFTNPAQAMGRKAQAEFMRDLADRGIQPTNVIDKKGGQRVEKIIFPGAIVSYGGFETGVMLLKGNKARTSEEEINQSIEGVEYELASAIEKLSNTEPKRIGMVTGHGEPDSLQLHSFRQEVSAYYELSNVRLEDVQSLQRYDALVLIKPTVGFTQKDKYWLDQYIMRGGKVLFLLDKLGASMDSASREDYFSFPYELNLDDLLFRYGVRINLDLVQDRHAGLTPVVTGHVGGKPQVQLMDWPFFPLINHYAEHPITRNLDAVVTRFISSIDTVKAPGITKTPLLFTSAYARKIGAPVKVSINDLRKNTSPEDFTAGAIPVGYLLEGRFTSLFKNRFLPEGTNENMFVPDGEFTRLVVMADGDLARNEVHPRTRVPQALGFDPFTNYTFANRDLLLNTLAYLTSDKGLIQSRTKEVKIRPLDRDRVNREKWKWQMINLAGPLLLLVVYGVFHSYRRKRKYASF